MKERAERSERGSNGVLEIPGADALGHTPVVEVVHQLDQAPLRLLRSHGLPLDGADLLEGGVLLLGRKCVDVVEDVGGLVNA